MPGGFCSFKSHIILFYWYLKVRMESYLISDLNYVYVCEITSSFVLHMSRVFKITSIEKNEKRNN